MKKTVKKAGTPKKAAGAKATAKKAAGEFSTACGAALFSKSPKYMSCRNTATLSTA